MSIELSSQQGAAKAALDDAELVRQARICIYGTKQTDALLVKMADRIEALIAERDAARDAALEEAAEVADGYSRSEHIAEDMEAGIFPQSTTVPHYIAAAIRALKGQSQ